MQTQTLYLRSLRVRHELTVISNTHIINPTHDIYNNNKMDIKIKSDLSNWRHINKGVRQDCGLSPLLFIICMDNVLKC
jgi:hypothetical protein